TFIEQRFKELYATIPYPQRPEINLELYIELSNAHGKKERFNLNLPSGATIGNVLDEVYFRISDMVGAYTFLTEWTLVEAKTGRELSFDTLKQVIPASTVFKSGQIYQLKMLKAGVSRR